MGESRATLAQLDLVAEVMRLRTSPMPHGQVSKMLLHQRDLRVILTALREGAQLARHHADVSEMLHVLDGRILVTMRGENHVLSAGHLLAIGAWVDHAIVAVEDTAYLLIVGGRTP